jgi:hypothetical protein
MDAAPHCNLRSTASSLVLVDMPSSSATEYGAPLAEDL